MPRSRSHWRAGARILNGNRGWTLVVPGVGDVPVSILRRSLRWRTICLPSGDTNPRVAELLLRREVATHVLESFGVLVSWARGGRRGESTVAVAHEREPVGRRATRCGS